MVVTYETEMLVFDEMEPETYPEVPQSALVFQSDTAGVPDWIWQRIEAYCNWRWTPREAQIVVDGGMPFNIPARPFRITKVEKYPPAPTGLETMEWYEVPTSYVTQMGWRMIPCGELVRITGIVGEDNPAPPAVIQAAVRLHGYLGHTPESYPMWATGRSHTAEHTTTGEGGGSTRSQNESFQRRADYMALAMQHSGAADLLRRYRRAR